MEKVKKVKNLLLETLFPEFCLGCGKLGAWLCKDCESLLEIQNEVSCPVCGKLTFNFKTHEFCRGRTILKGLFWPVRYQNPLVKKLILKFKYKPFAENLAKPLAQLLTSHFLLTQFPLSESGFVLVPIPLTKKRLKWRGFNQAEKVSREISDIFHLPMEHLLAREKERMPQIEIKEPEKRKENIKGVFSCSFEEKIGNKKILLIDDVCTTRATLEEAAKVLKAAGFKEIWAAVVAKG